MSSPPAPHTLLPEHWRKPSKALLARRRVGSTTTPAIKSSAPPNFLLERSSSEQEEQEEEQDVKHEEQQVDEEDEHGEESVNSNTESSGVENEAVGRSIQTICGPQHDVPPLPIIIPSFELRKLSGYQKYHGQSLDKLAEINAWNLATHSEMTEDTSLSNVKIQNEIADESKSLPSTFCSSCGLEFTPYSIPPQAGGRAVSPKFLNCLHIFCVSCVQKIALPCSDESEVAITCPTCCKVTRLSCTHGKGRTTCENIECAILNLPTARISLRHFASLCQNCEAFTAAWRCLECPASCALLCEECYSSHREMKAFRQHEISKLDISDSFSGINLDSSPPQLHKELCDICPIHSEHDLRYFCRDCDKLVCSACLFYLHNGHKFEASLDGAEKIRSRLLQNQTQVENCMRSIKSQLMLTRNDLGSTSHVQNFLSSTFQLRADNLDNIASRAENNISRQIEDEHATTYNNANSRLLHISDVILKREHFVEELSTIVHDKHDFQLLSVTEFIVEHLPDMEKDIFQFKQNVDEKNLLVNGSLSLVDRSLGSSGLIRESKASADVMKSSISDIKYATLNGLACIEMRILLKNDSNEALLSGGHPITIEVFDLEGTVVVRADNEHMGGYTLPGRCHIHDDSSSDEYPYDVNFMLLDRGNGMYDFFCFSRNSLFVSCHVKVLGEHVSNSPSLYICSCCDDEENIEEVFGPVAGKIGYASSTYVSEFFTGDGMYRVENIRTCDDTAGWMTNAAYDEVESVVTVFTNLILLQRIVLYNWSAVKYCLYVRKCKAVKASNSDPDSLNTTNETRTAEIVDEWVALNTTPCLIEVPLAQCWSLNIDDKERMELGPIDAVRLDISGGSYAAFYGLNIFGFILNNWPRKISEESEIYTSDILTE